MPFFFRRDPRRTTTEPKPDDSQPTDAVRTWTSLGTEEQTRLLEAYGRYLDTLPPTCNLDTKIERLRRWLASQGIDYADPG